MIDFTALQAVLNTVIMPAVKDQMYEKAPSWQLVGGWSAAKQVATRANVGVDKFENNKMYISIRDGYHSGIVNIQPGQKYQYGQPQWDQTYNQIKTLVGSFIIPKAVLNTSDKGAVIRPLMNNSRSLANDMAMESNRQLYTKGDGVIATAASASGGTSTTLYLTPSVNGDIVYSRYFPKGLIIAVGASGPMTVASATGNTVTLVSPGGTWSASDPINRVNGSNVNCDSLDGFPEMVSASITYQNLSVAAAPLWASSEDAAIETLTGSTIQSKMFSQYFLANQTGSVNWILANRHAFQCYGESLTGQVRFDPKEVLTGGWVGLDFMAGQAKILLDFDCNDDSIYFMTMDEVIFGEFQPLEWEKGTDGMLFKIQQQLDYEVTASWMGNIGTTVRSAHSKLHNKTFTI
jgi:hypothetical protein